MITYVLSIHGPGFNFHVSITVNKCKSMPQVFPRQLFKLYTRNHKLIIQDNEYNHTDIRVSTSIPVFRYRLPAHMLNIHIHHVYLYHELISWVIIFVGEASLALLTSVLLRFRHEVQWRLSSCISYLSSGHVFLGWWTLRRLDIARGHRSPEASFPRLDLVPRLCLRVSLCYMSLLPGA